MSKKYDVVATTGTYEKNGEKKYISRNVGAIIQTQHGFRLKLDASFNPAGCPRNDDGSVWLALFEPKPRENQQSASYQQQAPVQQSPATPHVGGEFEDDIPFMRIQNEYLY